MNFEPLLDPETLDTALTKYQEKHGIPAQVGMVIYTDGGGLLANRAYSGNVNLASYGVHGMVYLIEDTNVGAGVNGYHVTNTGYELKANIQVDRVDPSWMQDYQDYLSKNKSDRRAGDISRPDRVIQLESSTVIPLFYVNAMGGIYDGTNQVGEMIGFITALKLVQRVQQQTPLVHVHFKCDSKYVLQRVIKRFQDQKSGWRRSDGGMLANLEHIKELSATLEETLQPKTLYTCEWIEGHADSFGNIQADSLASKALIGATNGVYNSRINSVIAKGHWASLKKSATKNSPESYFLVDQQWYYNNHTTPQPREDGLTAIFVGTHITIGQPDSESIMGVAFLKEPPLVFAKLVELSKRLDRVDNGLETHGVFVSDVNEILKPELLEDVMQYEGDYLRIGQSLRTISTSKKKPLLTRVAPVELSLEHMQKFDRLLFILERVTSGKLSNKEYLNDITDQVYKTTGEGKNKKTALLIGADSSFKVDVKVNTHNSNHMYQEGTYTVTLSHGITTPRKRVYTGLKDQGAKIYVLTIFEAYVGFRYFTIIQLTSGEWGIWTNPEANLRVF